MTEVESVKVTDLGQFDLLRGSRCSQGAALVCLFRFFVEINGGCVQIVALGHEFVHGFTSLKQVLQILVHNVLHLLQFFLYAEQLVCVCWVLPLAEEHFKLSELQRMV